MRRKFDSYVDYLYRRLNYAKIVGSKGTASVGNELHLNFDFNDGCNINCVMCSKKNNYATQNYTILMASGLQRYLAFFTLCGACLSCILYVWLIPRYGVTGAALATSISYSGFGMMLQFIIKETRVITVKYYMSILKTMPAIIAMSLCIYLIHDYNLVVIVFLALCIYFAVLVLSRVLNSSDIQFISNLVKYH